MARQRKIKAAGAAVEGRGHVKEGLGCQDRVAVKHFIRNRAACVALADGAGSCQHSDLGADLVTRHVGDLVHARFAEFCADPDEARRAIVAELQTRLRARAGELGVDVKQLSSTLLFAYVTRTRRGARYLCGHIGDGVVAKYDGYRCDVVSHPENGEFSNSTFFVTSSEAADHLRICVGEGSDAVGFLLFSDGTGETLYSKREQRVAPAAAKMVAWFDDLPVKHAKEALQANLRSVFREMTQDDCSLAVLKLTAGRSPSER